MSAPTDKSMKPFSGQETDVIELELYIAGDSPNSVMARTNLLAICDEYLPERYKLEIVDLLEVPEQALANGVLVAPTLIKRFPLPVRQIMGNLSERGMVVNALGLGGDAG